MPPEDITVVVRECGERTADVCVMLLKKIFPGRNIHRVTARPFSATLKLALEKGRDEGCPWTLCIDADVLPTSGLLNLLNEALGLPESTFEVQGLVHDKLMSAPRPAGNHLYRTALIETALPLIAECSSLRPETEMIGIMAQFGYPNHQSGTIVGLHDFEQSLEDVYSKATLHAHKHRFLAPLLKPLWQMLAPRDPDFRVALAAMDDAESDQSTPEISRDFRRREASARVEQLGLGEKPPFAYAPDADAISAMAGRLSLPRDAAEIGCQIESLTRRGLFGDSPPSSSESLDTPPTNGSVRPRVIFACDNAYPLFDPGIWTTAGGMERRAAMLARGLSRRGDFKLGFVVSDFGQAFTTWHEGIDFHIYQSKLRRYGRNVFPRFRKRRWFPTLNLDRHDLDLLWQIPLIAGWMAFPGLAFPRFWQALGADAVCCFGNNRRSSEIVADCRRAGITTILSLASDEDLSDDYRPDDRRKNPYGMPNWMGYYALIHADAIIVQTETQRQLLRERFDRKGTIIRNPVHVSVDDPDYWLPYDKRRYVLWIGHADEFSKRPSAFVELAKRLPDIPFVQVISPTDLATLHTVKLARPDNLEILVGLPHYQILEKLRFARVLVNTSTFEGFPNVFLQAAQFGVTIVSLQIDPDGFLARDGCGICSEGSIEHLADAVRLLWRDADISGRFARNAHRHALANHRIEARVDEFAACIRRAMSATMNIPAPIRAQFWRRFTE